MIELQPCLKFCVKSLQSVRGRVPIEILFVDSVRALDLAIELFCPSGKQPVVDAILPAPRRQGMFARFAVVGFSVECKFKALIGLNCVNGKGWPALSGPGSPQ